MRRASRDAQPRRADSANALRAYAGIQIALHWANALLLFVLFPLGYYMTSLPRGTPAKVEWVGLHKSMGLTAALVIAWRVAERLRRSEPPLMPGLRCWEAEVARITHRVLYMCMVVMPLSGYLGSSFNQYGTRFWGLLLPRWGWVDTTLQHLFYAVHATTSYLLLALALLHVVGVVKHEWLDRKACLQRMLPAGRARSR
ncbi:cytochrome b [Cupriavidus sp. WKF15]|uniref:cytochrome b n=1 Tax=Cupriavidus sp. WKF15 TaxID=3032282 RepID=UPI0023E13A48|nr:cytochrome b [Cupriavidus sp. WKF15]WER50944.1 cytochrome b [Cupriavidus sp. WKF15]